MQIIRAIFFDIGGVIASPDSTTIDRWQRRLGIPLTDLYSAVYGGNDELAGIGRMTETDWWQHVQKRLSLADEQFSHLVADFTRRLVNSEIVAFARTLRPRFRTGYLSNAWSGERARLEALGIADAVDQIVISAEVGTIKPDQAIFRIALQRLNVEAAQAILVDDTPANIDAANDIGMRGILFADTAQAIRDISQMLHGECP